MSSPAHAATSTTPMPEVSPPPDTFPTGTDIPPDFSSFSDIDPGPLLNIQEGIGYLYNLGLDYGYGFTTMCQWTIEHVHIWAGLPWWASIVAATVFFRAAIFKMTMDASENQAKMADLKRDPRYQVAWENYTSILKGKHVEAFELVQAKQEMNRIHEMVGYKMWKGLLPMIQIPFTFGMYRLLRGMAALPVPGLEDGGVLWFHDLTVADPYFILPCVSSVMLFASMRLNRPFMAPEQAKMLGALPYVIAPVTILATMGMPAMVQFFFAFVAITQYLQTYLWTMPLVRRWFGLPPRTMHPAPDAGPSSGGSPAVVAAPRPVVGAGGIVYQAPRTISTEARPAATVATTATATKPSADGSASASGGADGMVSAFKGSWRAMLDKAHGTKDKKEADKVAENARQYEKKRREADKERLEERRQTAQAERIHRRRY